MHFDHSKVWNSSRYGRLGWLGGEVGMVGGGGATIPPLGMVTIPPPWDGWAVWPSTIPTLNAHPENVPFSLLHFRYEVSSLLARCRITQNLEIHALV